MLATSVGALAKKASEAVVGEMAKDAYHKVKEVFGWKADPEPANVPELAKQALADNPDKFDAVQAIVTEMHKQNQIYVEQAGNVGDNFGTQNNTFNR